MFGLQLRRFITSNFKKYPLKSFLLFNSETSSPTIASIVHSSAYKSNFRSFIISSHCSNMDLTADKEKYLNLPLNQKRAEYQCKSKFVTLDSIPTWNDYLTKLPVTESTDFAKNEALNRTVSIFVGDITALEIDCIVNAANNSLRGGGGVDGAIHRAAGPKLLSECKTLNGCPTGEAKITGGYRLPAKYVIHTVGPIGEKPDLLKNCYLNCLNIAKENNLKSIAFPCISTGVYGYPNANAAHIALKTVREFLEQNTNTMERVIFCLFLDVDVKIYEDLMQVYFPA